MEKLNLYAELREVQKDLDSSVRKIGQANVFLGRAKEAFKAYSMVWDKALEEIRKIRDEKTLSEMGIIPS